MNWKLPKDPTVLVEGLILGSAQLNHSSIFLRTQIIVIEVHRVNRFVVFVNLIMQVRTNRFARVSYKSNYIAPFYSLTRSDRNFAHVPVKRKVSITMVDTNVISVARSIGIRTNKTIECRETDFEIWLRLLLAVCKVPRSPYGKVQTRKHACFRTARTRAHRHGQTKT